MSIVKPNKQIRGKGENSEDATNALLQKLVDMLSDRANNSQPIVSDTMQYQKLFDMLVERLSKISGALRYKDAGMIIQINGVLNNFGRFTCTLPSDIQFFQQASYEISLQTFAVEQSIPNVTSTNNTFYFSSPNFASGAMQSIVLPNGTYDLDTINATIQVGMKNLGFYNTNPAATSINGAAAGAFYYISIGWSPATLKTVLYIQYGSGVTVYFNQPNGIANVLGFLSTDVFTDPIPTQTNTSATVSWFARFDSTNTLNLTVGILSLNFCCDLVRGSVFIQSDGTINASSKVLASKPYIDPPGAILSLPASNYPYTPLWLRMDDNYKKLRVFSVFCVDNNNNAVSFGGNIFNMVIGIRQA